MKHVKLFEEYTKRFVKGQPDPFGFGYAEIDRIITEYLDKEITKEEAVKELKKYYDIFKDDVKGSKWGNSYEDIAKKYKEAIEFVKSDAIDDVEAVELPDRFVLGEAIRHIAGFINGSMTKEEAIDGLRQYHDLYKDETGARFGRDVKDIAKEYADAIEYIEEYSE